MDSLPLECPECGERFPQESGFCPHDGAELLESGAPTLVFDADESGGRSFSDGTAEVGERSSAHSREPIEVFESEYTKEDDQPRVPRVPSALPPPRPRPAPTKDPLLNTMVGSYLVEGLLGQGGMGRIYRAVHTGLRKPVAIKVLRVEVAGDDEANARFVREARSTSALGHPNIVDVLDFGALEDGRSYFVMELLEGGSLHQVIQRLGHLEPRRALRMVERLASALQAAHTKGVVHRDLKPGNVFVCGDVNRSSEVKLLDFGIAKIANATVRLTVAGSIFGTPQYMAPEQCVGAEVDHRADIYALGIMLFEMLTGRPPFDHQVPVEILIMQRSSPIPSLPPELSVLQPLIMRVLAKDPEERFQTMRDFGVAVEDASDALNAPQVPHAPPQRQPPISRYPAAQPSQPPSIQPPTSTPSATPEGRGQARTVGFDYDIPAATAPAPLTTPSTAEPTAALKLPPPAAAPPPRRRGRIALLILGALSVIAIGAALVVALNPFATPDGAHVVRASLITVTSEPAGAQLHQGETLVGVTPCPVERPTSDQEFRLSLTGHTDVAFTLGPSSPDAHSVVLAPTP